MKRTKAQKQELKQVDQYFAKLKREAKKSSVDQPVIILRKQLRRFKKLAIYALEMELQQGPSVDEIATMPQKDAQRLVDYITRLKKELFAIKRFPIK